MIFYEFVVDICAFKPHPISCLPASVVGWGMFEGVDTNSKSRAVLR